ncbi:MULTISPECIES: Pycsar system effector family protein [Streptomyces]|nr:MULTISPECIES: Pycsar system effector family protein [Streptomyces]NNG85671.1 hypothetical protein [Streptomyces cacaoi]QHF96457.1 hypothetical protein DEH18_24355 [Streptomyces sp. NHF165]
MLTFVTRQLGGAMSAARPNSVRSDDACPDPVPRIRALAAEAFAELQRCDTKAAALCATALAVLAAVTTVLVEWPGLPVVVACMLWASVVTQAGSVAVAVAVIRPSLRAQGERPVSFLDVAGSAPEEVLAAVRRSSPEEAMLADSCRAAELSVLARRKYGALRRAATLLIVGISMAALAGLSVAAQFCAGAVGA